MTHDEYMAAEGVTITNNCGTKEYRGLENIIGEEVWVVDYRINPDNPAGRLARPIPPTKARIFSEKDSKRGYVYYSPIFFKKISKSGKCSTTEIHPFDGTGFRSYPGVSINIFRTEKEANEFFLTQLEKAQGIISDFIQKITDSVKERQGEIDKMYVEAYKKAH